MQSARVRRLFTFILALSLCLTMGCKKKEVRNEKCESDCVSEFESDLAACQDDTLDCLAGCTGPDDTTCVWDCEEQCDNAMFGLSLCSSNCPCLEEATSCLRGCQSGEEIDIDCAVACQDEYADCSGADSPYLCATLCQSSGFSCEFSCEDTALSSDEFVACREDCSNATIECLGDC